MIPAVNGLIEELRNDESGESAERHVVLFCAEKS